MTGKTIAGKALDLHMKKPIETILVADDDWLMIIVAQTVLESLGYQVIPASSGKEAIERYKENRDYIDLVILDIAMPELSGPEALEPLRQLNPRIKIMLCGGPTEGDIACSLVNEKKCFGFIPKPWRLSEIEKSVRTALDA